MLVPCLIGPNNTFKVHPFRGKQHLLKEIPKRLRAYAGWLPDDWRIAVLVDEDRQDCHELKKHLVDAARDAGIESRVLCRVAVEELEVCIREFKWPISVYEESRHQDPRAAAARNIDKHRSAYFFFRRLRRSRRLRFLFFFFLRRMEERSPSTWRWSRWEAPVSGVRMRRKPLLSFRAQ